MDRRDKADVERLWYQPIHCRTASDYRVHPSPRL